MIALIQRVSYARVVVEEQLIAKVGQGMLAFIGVERGDGQAQADRLLQRVLGYRIFADAEDKMNLNVKDIHGGLLLVPQFTLAADTRKGNRPGFSTAATPQLGMQCFDYFVQQARQQFDNVACGRFGADMKVQLENDGPVTFWLQVTPDSVV